MMKRIKKNTLLDATIDICIVCMCMCSYGVIWGRRFEAKGFIDRRKRIINYSSKEQRKKN